MKIAVTADTHSPPSRIDAALLDRLSEFDLLIHAGDICSVEVLRRLQSVVPVLAVWGNNDDVEVRRLVPQFATLVLAGRRIEILHGHQARTATRAARDVAKRLNPNDAVIFGHSHQAMNVWEDGVLLFNPGTPTAPRFSKRRTYGVITLEEPEATIVDLL